MPAAKSKKKPKVQGWTGGSYQVSMLPQLDPDEPLDPQIVLLRDERWRRALDQLRAARWISVDTEFYGPWKSKKEIDYWEARLRLIQVGLPSGLKLIADFGGLLDDRDRKAEEHAEFLAILREKVEDPKVPKVGQTLLTEYLLFRIWLGWKMRCMRDVMLMSQVIWAGVASKQFRWVGPGEGRQVRQETLKHSLKAICERLGMSLDKTEQASDWAGRLTNRQLNYAGRDVLYPRKAWLKLAEMAAEDGLLNSVLAECDAQPAFCECEYNGQPVDEPMLRRDLEKWDLVREAFLRPFRKRFPSVNPGSPGQVALHLADALDSRRCRRCGEVHDPVAEHARMKAERTQANLRAGKDDPPPGSAPWMAAALEDACADDWKECRACGAPKTDLERLYVEDRAFDVGADGGKAAKTNDVALAAVQEIPYVRALLEWRSASTQRNWLQAVLDNLRGGRIRGDYQQIAGGADHRTAEDKAGRGMGRSSCGRPVNLQNPGNLQPAHENAGAPSVRRCIRPPTSASGLGLRLAAAKLRAGTFREGSAAPSEDDVRIAAAMIRLAEELEGVLGSRPADPARLREAAASGELSGDGALSALSLAAELDGMPARLKEGSAVFADACRVQDLADRLLGSRSRAFIVADLSQAHARIACQVSQDPVLLRDFRAGVDFHLAMAHKLLLQQMEKTRAEAAEALRRCEEALSSGSVLNLAAAKSAHEKALAEVEILAADPSFEDVVRIYKDKKHRLFKLVKTLRKTAKPVNYGSLNLQGPPTLKSTAETSPEPVYFTLEEAKRYGEAWRSLYAGLSRFQRDNIRRANAHFHSFEHIGVGGIYGEVRALTGRRLFLIKEWQPRRGGYSVKGTDAVSAVWMMTEADAIKRAMGWLIADFDARPEWGAIFTNMAHDEINVECWAEHAEAVALQVQRRFHEAMRWAGVTDIPVDEPGADHRNMVVASWAGKA